MKKNPFPLTKGNPTVQLVSSHMQQADENEKREETPYLQLKPQND